jgi:hypothetical protein
LNVLETSSEEDQVCSKTSPARTKALELEKLPVLTQTQVSNGSKTRKRKNHFVIM